MKYLGVCGVIWGLFWWKFAHNSPEEHPTISKEELEFIKLTVPQVTYLIFFK